MPAQRISDRQSAEGASKLEKILGPELVKAMHPTSDGFEANLQHLRGAAEEALAQAPDGFLSSRVSQFSTRGVTELPHPIILSILHGATDR